MNHDVAIFGSYGALLVAVNLLDFQLQAEINQHDLNGDGVFSGAEITPQFVRQTTICPINAMILQTIESWIERGRRREVLIENDTSMMRYGNRCRLFFAINACIYGCALTVGLIASCFATEHPPTLWIVLTAFGVLTLFASISFCYVLSCRVEVRDDTVTVYCFGLTYSVCHREQIVTAYKSRVDESLVLVSSYGRKTRVSPRLDGLKALAQWLMLCPETVLTDSILDWMRSESPEFGEQWDARKLSNAPDHSGQSAPATS